MTEIYDEKISACHNNITKLFRCVLLQHNIIAGHHFNSSPFMALHHYYAVISLAEKYQNNISDIHQTLVKLICLIIFIFFNSLNVSIDHPCIE